MNTITILGILLFLAAVSLGFYEGRTRARKPVVVLSGATILGLSNLLECWPWFLNDASTWFRTYWTGLLQIGLGLLVIDVLPFLIAYLIGRRGAKETVK